MPRTDDKVFGAKVLLLVSSLLTLALLMYAAWAENIAPEWRGHQQAYRAALVDRAETPQERAVANDYRVEYRQAYLPAIDRVDRCVTCHVGVEDPAMGGATPPLAAHPGDWLATHPVEQFGCTVCHGGQGRATTVDDAHGEVPFWDAPLLRGEAVYTSCGSCHYENDLFGAEQDLYGHTDPDRPIYANELAATLPGAAGASRGKQLLLTSGCLGCHQYRGKGGRLGPDITYVGDKPKHDYVFAHVQGPHEPAQWLFEHFKFPREVTPGTLMPDLGLTDAQAWDLTAYMLSQHRKGRPARYTPLPQLAGGPPASGSNLYGMFCASCHGRDGSGSEVEGIRTPSLSNPDTLAVASDEYLRTIVTHGRPRTKMLAWNSAGGGLTAGEIDTVVAHVRSWESRAPRPEDVSVARGDARVGAGLYRQNCAGCHGTHGEGGIGTKLNAGEFLAIASDEFLRDTLVHGRPNTAMIGWKQLSGENLSDLLAYIRTWSQPKATLAEVEALTPNLRIGKRLFRSNCANCHGKKGQGDIGPALNNQDLLALADTEFLFEAIVHGRPGTAMPAWHHLSSEDVSDLMGYLRSWQKVPARQVPKRIAAGEWANGQALYAGACASCHGGEGEGGLGPQLNNPVLLRSASDGMLYDMIAHGRTSTQMRPFLKRHGGVAEFSQRQIEDIVAFIRRWEGLPRTATARPGHGFPEAGAEVYTRACVQCHGADGQGGTAPALGNPKFLRAASDGYLIATIILGREGTEMRSMGRYSQGNVQLSSREVQDVVAYIRQWEEEPTPGIPHRYVQGDANRGLEAYGSFCVGCHGAEGRGGYAPELNNQGFLTAATDGFLQATIVRGRQGTPMRPFGIGAQGVAELSTQTINDLVVYLRSWDAQAAPPPVGDTTPTPAEPAGSAE